jgi:excisionase family DNA binding protein
MATAHGETAHHTFLIRKVLHTQVATCPTSVERLRMATVHRNLIDAPRLSIPQLAKRLGLAESTAWRLVYNREIHSIKIGGRRFVFVHDVEKYLSREVNHASC